MGVQLQAAGDDAEHSAERHPAAKHNGNAAHRDVQRKGN